MNKENPTNPSENPDGMVPAAKALTSIVGPSRRRNGKVAHLPQAVRDRICSMIQDGNTYLEIINQLGPDGQGLNEDNLSNWRSGGYLDWIREQNKLDMMREKRDLIHGLLVRQNGSHLHQTILQVVATNVCEFLVDTDPEVLRESLLSDSDKFTRFVHAMVKLAEGEIKCEQHQNFQDDRAQKLQKKPSAGVSDESIRTAETKLNLL